MSENVTTSGLVLHILKGQRLLINGPAAIAFRTKTSLVLENQCRFVFGKQIMTEEQASSSIDLLYLAIQRTYIDDADPRAVGRAAQQALRDWPQFSPYIREALFAANAGRHYAALKCLVQIARLPVEACNG